MRLKIQVLCSFLLCIAESFETHKIRRQRNEKPLSQNCTYEHINADVFILKSGSQSDGLVKIRTPLSQELHTICYPVDVHTSDRQVVKLSHAVCRQLGYMTYSSSSQHVFPAGTESRSVQANIYCKGTVQSLDDCSWCDFRIDNCSSVLATECTACHSILEAPEGFITNPGNPHVYLYTVHCQWDIIVPEGHNILLTFRQLFLPESRWGAIRCEFGQPHVEIIYGTERALTVQRYCRFNYVRTIKVPERKVTVRFYSGIYPGSAESTENEYGFNLHFQAEPMEQSSLPSFKVVVVAGIGIAVVVVMISCYCCRKIGAKYSRSQSFRRAASRSDASSTAEAGRVATFHQRPDFTGVIDKENAFIPVRKPCRRQFVSEGEIEAVASLETCHRNDGRDMKQSCMLEGTPSRPRNERLFRESQDGVMSKLKTSLFSRFAAINNSFRNCSATNQTAASSAVIPQVTNFHIYNSFASKSTDSESLYECPKPVQGSEQVKSTKMSDTHEKSPLNNSELSQQSVKTFAIPTIVVECVDESSASNESSMSSEENYHLKASS